MTNEGQPRCPVGMCDHDADDHSCVGNAYYCGPCEVENLEAFCGDEPSIHGLHPEHGGVA